MINYYRFVYFSVCAWLCLLLLAAPVAWAQAPAASPGTTPSVGTVLNPDGTLRAGAQGSFNATGYQLSYGKGGQPVLRTTAAGWNALGSGAAGMQNGASDPILAVAVDGSNIYVGGNFTTAGGIVANHVARWDGMSWSSLGTGTANGVNDVVFALAVSGPSLYVGGGFDQAGGAAASYVARWDNTTSTWSPLGTGTANGVNYPVNALAVSGTALYAGGYFTQAGGVAASYVARWDNTAATWSPLGAGVSDAVFALAVSGPSLYVGGQFTQAGGAAANSVARWDGTAWNPLGTGATNGVDQAVNALAVSGGSLYVGGQLTQAGGAPASYVARWNGTAWSALGTGATPNGVSSFVYALASSASGVCVGGQFTQASGLSAKYVASWDGTTWRSLGTDAANGVSGTVQAVAIAGQNIYVGGYFSQAGDIAANNVARWNGTAWSSLGTGAANGVNSLVSSLAVSGTDVYVGGYFSQAGGVAASCVARWDGATWSPLGTGTANGVNSLVYALAASGSTLYVGGQFTTASGVPANYIAKWDGAAWSSLGTGSATGTGTANGVDGPVFALAVSGGSVYAGGFFSQAGGLAASYVARWNGDAWSPLGSGTTSPVLALATNGGSVYAGGGFTQAGGVAANYVAQWDGTAWSPLGTSTTNGVGNTVNALAVSGGSVYVGGQFTTASGVVANYIAQWDGTAWSSLGTGAVNGLGGPAYALAVASTGVYAGGDFTQAGGIGANRVAYYFGTPATATPLPVQLLTFTAQAQGTAAVRLDWSTASEASSARFEVERSTDGVSFLYIGQVAAAGTATTAHSYGLVDAALPAGANTLYYRLRQVDLSGTATYSPVCTVQLPTGATRDGLAVYPNPAVGLATLMGAAAGAAVQVLDALGQVVATATADASGSARLVLPGNLASGVYVVRTGARAVRLVVQ